MKEALSIVGGICVASTLLGCLVYIGNEAALWFKGWKHRRRLDADKLAKIEVGKDIKIYAHWFSDDPEHERLLKTVGQYIQDNGFFDASSVRSIFQDRK